MRHRKHTFKIGRSGAHRKALLANQVCSLIRQGAIKTTLTKAKETRRIAEKMVTLAKKGGLHHRRLAIARLHDVDAVALLFAEIAPKHANRDGGYTRIVKLGTRRGDAAEMCVLAWVEEEKEAKSKKSSGKKRSKTGSSAPKKQESAPEEPEDKESEKKAETSKEKTESTSSEKSDEKAG